MKIPRHVIASVLARKSLGKITQKQFAQQIAAYLLAERRTADLDSLLRDIMQDRANDGIVEVIATSAHDLTPALKTDIERRIRTLYPLAKQIIITPEHDASVIGGVRLNLANQQLDLSVRNKLNRFKQITV